jgi:hypothetical protein
VNPGAVRNNGLLPSALLSAAGQGRNYAISGPLYHETSGRVEAGPTENETARVAVVFQAGKGETDRSRCAASAGPDPSAEPDRERIEEPPWFHAAVAGRIGGRDDPGLRT